MSRFSRQAVQDPLAARGGLGAETPAEKAVGVLERLLDIRQTTGRKMRVACHQCSANLVINETQLELGVVRTECVECQTRLFVDQSGRVYATEAELAEANDLALDPDDEPSDAYATIPLPSLSELGLNLGPRAPRMTTEVSRDSGSPPDISVATADLDADDDQVPLASGAAAGTASNTETNRGTVPPSRRGAPLGGRFNLPLPMALPPVTRHGWMVFAGLALGGLLLGAVLSSGGSGADTPFDREVGLRMLDEGTKQASACLEGETTSLEGALALRFAPSGEAESLELSGPVAESPAKECIEDALTALEVPAFSGPAVIVKRRFANR